MKQLINLILPMILSVISSSLYAQYPMVKKIGNDTVVVMTLKQGEEINQKFQFLQDSVLLYKKRIDTVKRDFSTYQTQSGMRLQKMYNSYWNEYENAKFYKAESDSFRHMNMLSKIESDNYRHMYMANKLIYLDRENTFKKEIRSITIFATVLGALAVFFAHQ